ncbi:MAG: oxidoreductase [Methanoculleus sp. SDB]|nr:MAG: oxidoreductase [Methanoculleus sp. SDB]
MSYRLLLAVVIVAGAVLLALLLTVPGIDSPELTLVSAGEIRNYEGEDLSSIRDFRENSIRGPQHITITAYTLTVDGLVDRPLSYRYDDIVGSFPRYGNVVTLSCVEGWSATIFWEGVRVQDLITPAGIDPRSDTIIFHAYDGYSTSFPRSYIEDNDIILAYRMNNVTLPPERGYPFTLVAEDKWGYKWIKWVTAIELSDDPGYRGYWESRGYSQDANLSRGFFG